MSLPRDCGLLAMLQGVAGFHSRLAGFLSRLFFYHVAYRTLGAFSRVASGGSSASKENKTHMHIIALAESQSLCVSYC